MQKKSDIQLTRGRTIFGCIQIKTNRLILKFADANMMILIAWEDFIPAKKEVVIGGFDFLDDWIIRGEMFNALPKAICEKPQDQFRRRVSLCRRKSLESICF